MRHHVHTLSRFLLFTSCLAVAPATPAAAQAPSAPNDSAAGLLLVTNWGDDAVSLVDVDAGRELAVIRVGSKPYDVKVDRSGRFGYVTNSGESTVSVIDIQAVLEARRIPVGVSPRDITLFPDGRRALVSNAGSNDVSVIDLSAGRELYRVPVGAIPYGNALSPDGRVALITNWGENTVSVLELAETSGRVVRTLPVGALPYTVVIPQGSTQAYVTTFGAHALTVIDLPSMQVAGIIPVGSSPWGLASTPDGSGIAVANFYSGSVSLITPRAVDRFLARGGGAIARTSLVRASPTIVSPSIDRGGRPTVSDADLRAMVPVLDERAAGVQRLIQLPRLPGEPPTARRAAKNVASRNNQTWVVSDLAANRVLVLDAQAGTVLRSIAVGKAPYGLAFVSGQTAK